MADAMKAGQCLPRSNLFPPFLSAKAAADNDFRGRYQNLSPPPALRAILTPFPPIIRGTDEVPGGETGCLRSLRRMRGCRPPAKRQQAPVASCDASDGKLDRKTPKGGRSRHAQQIPIVGSGFRLFYSTSFRAKAAFHRAPKGRRDRALKASRPCNRDAEKGRAALCAARPLVKAWLRFDRISDYRAAGLRFGRCAGIFPLV